MNSQQHKRITLKDISEQCGYSVNTVSRTLRDDPRLPEATISRIKQVADELGYMKNIIASSMRSGHTNLIAVIVDDIQNPHYSDIISQISIKLRKYRYHTLILASYIEKNYADYSLSLALSYNVSGIVFFPRNYNKNAINLINQNKIPLVLIDREIPECQTDFVRCDDYQGGYLAGKHLLELGHRRFLYLPGPKYNLSQTRRYAGIMDALSEANVPVSNVRQIDYHTVFGSPVPSTSSYKSYEELFFPVDYTAVIGFNDLQSYSAMEILKERGYRIPEDISLISFDHLRKTHTYLPPLTSVADNTDKSIADTAVSILLDKIKNSDSKFTGAVLPVTIYDGHTTGPVNKAFEASF